MKSKEHEFVIKVRFDRPVSLSAALRAVRNQFDPVGIQAYATIEEEERDGWTEMAVKSIKSNKPVGKLL